MPALNRASEMNQAPQGRQMLPVVRISTAVGRKTHVALFLPSFELGGAEVQALELARGLDKEKYKVTVICLREIGPLAAKFSSLAELKVMNLNGVNPLTTFLRLMRWTKKGEVDILHSFLLSTNVYSLGVKIVNPSLRVIVGVRDSLADAAFGYAKTLPRLKTRLLRSTLDRMTSLADLVIVNSQAGQRVRLAESDVDSALIPNGIDTARFRPDSDARNRLRQLLAIPMGASVVGTVANITAYKGYPLLIQAARKVVADNPAAHFVCIGSHDTQVGQTIVAMVRDFGMESRVHFLGARNDVPQLLPGMDVFCSSSLSEGFSNAVAEAMACGIPCVVTDVGDSRFIVGDTGLVLPAGNSQMLASGILEMLSMEPARRV